MKQTINLSQFRDEFNAIRPNQFSYEALELIFNHFEQYEQDTGEEMELDVIAICCDVSEMTAEDFTSSYGYADEFDEDQKITLDEAIDYLNDHTTFIGQTDNTIVFFNF